MFGRCEATQLHAIGGGTNFSWWPSNATVANPVAFPDTNTLYICTTSTGECHLSDTAFVNVFPLPPLPVITQRGDTLFSSATTGNQWHYNGQILTDTNSFIVSALYGYYAVLTRNSYGCPNISNAYVYNDSTLSIQRINDLTDARLYPKP